jgi:hypothetical protein
MADVLDNFSNLTLNTQEATQDSDLIKVNPYLVPEVTRIHGVMTGVIMDKYIPILGQFEDIGKVDPGTCGVNEFTDGIPVSQKTWTPKLISSRITICADDIPAKLKFWMEQMKASGRWENINAPLKQFILDRAQEAVTRAIIRIAEFSDTAAALVANGGNMTAGTTLTYFTMLDGLWKQIFTDGALGSPLVARYAITENSEATKQLQLALADNAAYEAMANLVELLPPEAMAGKNVLQITKTLWDNWVRFIENKAGAYRPELLQDGMTKENFRGFPIIVRSDWDRMIRKYHDLGTTYYLPHRAILTDINNIPIGTSDTQSFSTIDAFYDKVTKKHYTDVAWRQDCKLLQENSISVAY